MKAPMHAGELARRAKQATESIAAFKKIPKPKKVQKNPVAEFERGGKIYVYHHLQTSQVVYSLTRVLKNNASLSQLPFNGKKTVPTALRKDLWHPLAQISFPTGSPAIGLSVFQKLREYRKRHELEWGDEIFLDKEGKPTIRRQRGRMICDQKANTVADMAEVLSRLQLSEVLKQAKVKKEEAELKEKEEKEKAERKAKGIVEPEPETKGAVVDAEGKPIEEKRTEEKVVVERKKHIGLTGEGTGTEIEVLWSDLQDAEFAETWGENVLHGPLPPYVSKKVLALREVQRLKDEEKAAKILAREQELEEKRARKAERQASKQLHKMAM